MKTLHYVAHIALLTTFVVFTVCIGFYVCGSHESRDAIVSFVKNDMYEHDHAPDIILAQPGNCRICKEMGISGCTAAVPNHLRGSAHRRVKATNGRRDANDVTFKSALAIWINSLIPETVKKDAQDHLEPEVLMTYAAWE